MTTVYVILLTLHNINRWLVLLFGLWAIIQNFSLLSGNRVFTAAERRPVAMFMGTLHLQVVLGLLLFALMGMQHIPVFAGARPSFQWEHLGMGVVAAIFGTLASVQSRKATTDIAKARAAVMWCSLAMIVVVLAIPWFRPLLRLFNL